MDGLKLLRELRLKRQQKKKIDSGYIQLTIFDLLEKLEGGRSGGQRDTHPTIR